MKVNISPPFQPFLPTTPMDPREPEGPVPSPDGAGPDARFRHGPREFLLIARPVAPHGPVPASGTFPKTLLLASDFRR